MKTILFCLLLCAAACSCGKSNKESQLEVLECKLYGDVYCVEGVKYYYVYKGGMSPLIDRNGKPIPCYCP